jgi:heptosyltransferase II
VISNRCIIKMPRFLIIQTAFIGDVILATPVIEKIHLFFPDSTIDFLLRKGNEGLFNNHPFLNKLIIWDKGQGKYLHIFGVIKKIRSGNYDYVINFQRYVSTGIFTVFSKGKITIGFDKNPLSFLFDKKIKHRISQDDIAIHEVNRNLELISFLTDNKYTKPALYPIDKDFEKVHQNEPYVCIAPTSVWFTKQLPANKWIELIKQIDNKYLTILTGGANDVPACDHIKEMSSRYKVVNLAGKLSFLESVALMKNAVMNFVNDSAPLHFASAINAPVTAVFCSTVPRFGFGPLSDRSKIVEVGVKLDCRPCGLHGYKSCPKGHFKCSNIEISDLLKTLNKS